MNTLFFVRIALLLVGMVLVAIEVLLSRRADRVGGVARLALTFVAVINLGFMVFLWVNHIRFPLNLDLMEGTVLQHFQRAARFEAIYPEPTPEYVPLAYNALYYVLAVPFSWVLGVNLSTLRLVAILGMLGSVLVVYLVVREKTGSTWWALMSAGLFAAAYGVMDAYLDTAHSDSWFLFAALLGSYLIGQGSLRPGGRERVWNLIGVTLLVAAFWFKQHGALFAIGGVLYLTWREGLRRSWPYWLLAIVLGPGLYLFAGRPLFGSHFHYFTWEVPRQWSEFNLLTFRRFIGFIVKSYPILALAGGILVLWTGVKERERFDIWHVQFVFALLTGLMGTLDIGSSNNVYIAMGGWFILMGTLGLYELAKRFRLVERYRLHLIALFVTLAILFYDPSRVITSPRAGQSYADLIDMLQGLEGEVYAPSLGQLQDGYEFYPAAHWVALEDMIRGPGRDTRNHPNTRALLEPALHPSGEAYVLANHPLDAYPWIQFLEEVYVLETDFGDRFQPLRVLPARWDHGWPRYLYRYALQ